MPTPNITDLDEKLDNAAANYLGEMITYATEGGTPIDFKADVDYADASRDLGAGHVVDQDIELQVRKSILPKMPTEDDRIVLSKLSGLTFKPSGRPSTDASGTHWVFGLKMVSS